MSQVGFGSMFPFDETKLKDNVVIREFKKDVDTEELIWHLDREDRELPVNLESKNTYFIPKYKYHRVIKGNGNLVVEITKLGDEQ